MKPGLMMDILAQQNADLRKRTGAGQTGGNLLLGGPGQEDADGAGRGVGGGSRFLRNPGADTRRAGSGVQRAPSYWGIRPNNPIYYNKPRGD